LLAHRESAPICTSIGSLSILGADNSTSLYLACIRGKRIRVTDILGLLSAGASFEEVLTDYPYLEREDILAALEYAAHQTDHVVLLTA
jgi:uncharacterized protein (DUF433 family)